MEPVTYLMLGAGIVMLLVGLFFLSGRTSMQRSRARVVGVIEMIAGTIICLAALSIGGVL